jgi:hypothetical protein
MNGTILLNKRRKINSQEQEQHHLIPLHTSVSRFALLPITIPSTTISHNHSHKQRPSLRNAKTCKTKPSPFLRLNPMKSSMSDIPLGIRVDDSNSTSSRVQGIMNAMTQKTSTSELFSNASSFITGVWGSSTSPKSSPKRLSK